MIHLHQRNALMQPLYGLQAQHCSKTLQTISARQTIKGVTGITFDPLNKLFGQTAA